MAVLDKEKFMARLQERIGEDTSDDALTFLEDMSDTYTDMETRLSSNNSEDWHAKYDELDKSWREKYKARFLNVGTTSDEIIGSQKEDVIDDGTEKTFDDLFEEREG